MIALIYILICIGIAFIVGIIPEGFGGTLLLGAILGVLLAILHQLTNIYKCIKKGNIEEQSTNKSNKIPIRN